MAGNILTSARVIERKRLTATAVSLFFTGFGQVYNGKLNSGIALMIMRALSMMVIPMYIQLKPHSDYTILFVSSLVINIIIFIYSPAEALYTSSKNRATALKKYNALPVYITFCFTGTVLALFSLFILMNFFEIKTIGEPSSILYKRGDRVLILKYVKERCRRGELVEYREAGSVKMGRIIGAGGDTVQQDKYTFSVNNVQLGIGTFDEQEMEKLALGDYGRILAESYGAARYPVKTDIEKDIQGKTMFRKKLGEDEILVADDDRERGNFYRVIKKEAVTGIVQGIITADNIKRVLLRPHLHQP